MDSSEIARRMAAMRKQRKGATANLQPCRFCGELMGTRARRKHEPECRKAKNLTAQPK